MKFGKYFVILPILSVLSACAQLGQLDTVDAEHQKMARSARTHADHDRLANYYDNLVREAEAKLQEKKAALKEYEAHAYYYGRQGLDLQSHAQGNIRYYEQTVRDAAKQADFHRKIAADLLKNNVAMPTEVPGQQDDLRIKAKLKSGSNGLTEQNIQTQ